MKSIIEEASSISKAIENAWKRADQPSDFTVRVFEIPQKNIFGFTTKSAKIGIFFEENKKNIAEPKKKDRPKQIVPQPKEKQIHQQNTQPRQQPARAPAAKQPTNTTATDAHYEPWNKEMVTYAQQWLDTLCKQLAIASSFTIDPQKYLLKIEFDKAIFEQEEKNRAFFRNCAHLLMQSVRNTFKRPLKGFKIVLTIK